jgi:D-sedoheptulose 7-phosphate isomerase
MSYPSLYRDQLIATLQAIDIATVDRIIAILAEARDAGRQIFVCGNGGSAASASHFTCDMVKGASFQKDPARRFKIIALNDMMPTMTAYANDVSYDAVFAEPLKNFARPGDVVICISGSGNSPNVLRAMEYANSAGCRTIAMTGRDGGKLGPLAEVNLHVAAPHMGRIEDAHMAACHMIAYHFMEADS